MPSAEWKGEQSSGITEGGGGRHDSINPVMLQRLKHSSQVPVMMPGAIMAFHWPRADLDQLLCIRYPAIVSL